MFRRVLPLALLFGCSHPRPSAPPPPPTPQVTIHVDPLRFKAGAALSIELVIASGYGCSKHYPMTMTVPTPPPAPCPAPPPDTHEAYTEPVAAAITISSAQLTIGRGFTVIVTGPAAEGCDLLRGYARGAATGGAVDAPPLDLVVIPQPCPA